MQTNLTFYKIFCECFHSLIDTHENTNLSKINQYNLGYIIKNEIVLVVYKFGFILVLCKKIYKWSDEGETSHLNYNEINDKLFILDYLIYWLLTDFDFKFQNTLLIS